MSVPRDKNVKGQAPVLDLAKFTEVRNYVH